MSTGIKHRLAQAKKLVAAKLLKRLVVTCVCTLIVTLPPASSRAQTVPSHHSEDGSFKNLYLDEEFTRSRFFTYVRMRFFGDEPFAEYQGESHKVPQIKADLGAIHQPNADTLQVTWIGHSTMLIQYRGFNVLTDPIFSNRASPFSFIGPKRYTPPALDLKNLPKVDYVVISHNHYDHLDLPTVNGLGDDVQWLVPLKLKPWFHNQGIQNVVELDWWQTRNLADLAFTATPTQHFSGRGLWDYAQTLWCSWIIQIGDKNIWFGGDTGYNDVQFKRIGREYGPFDLGFIPIGAFEPRWFMQPMHINPTEAVLVHRDINTTQSIGIHWGAFRFSAEPIDAPMLKLNAAAAAANVNFSTMAIGETRLLE